MGPLDGLKILDFSGLLPGPWATQQLVDLGAEVVRIESPNRPDLLKSFSHAFSRINQNKITLKIDLTDEQAQQSIRDMLSEFDIIIEQFRPGVMKKFNLDYDSLCEEFPRLIYCSLTGYGQFGPLKDRAGHDINYLSLSGSASYSGTYGPTLSGLQIADLAGGSLQAIVGILAAVIERQKTGKGQYIDIAMADGALALNVLAGNQVLGGHPDPSFTSEMLNGGSFYDYYQCSDGLWLSVGGLEPKFISGLCKALGKSEWAHRFTDLSSDSQRRLKEDLRGLFLNKTQQEWLKILDVDCCIEPVLTMSEALKHPHFIERGMVTTNADGKFEIGPIIKFRN